MTQRSRKAAIIGDGVRAAQCALTLARLGLEVNLITASAELDLGSTGRVQEGTSQEALRIRPLLLAAASHPGTRLYTRTKVDSIAGRRGQFTVRAIRQPCYVQPELCASCGRCVEACGVQVPFLQGGHWLTRSAIHAPLLGTHAVPSSYSIDKTGISPCRAACPLGINVQGFVSLLARGKVDRALSLINEAAPLAGVLGRVCTAPCEDACKRAEVDAPVFIRALHRYIADNASGAVSYTRKAGAGSRREKIAIVGSGPAGLAAAWELARRGFSPVIFESHAVVGGMLATGIPRFRLPREIREREVKAIEELGVEIRTGVTIGRDVTVHDLRERGYRAFFLAIGAHENRKLGIPGEELDGVVDSTSLLFELNLKVGAMVGRNMVVIGGGNSAVDSARTARRRGKRNVTIIYRRTAEEMTAVKEDIEEAIKEGIAIDYLTSPVEILGDGHRVSGIRCQRMALGEEEADGRRRPVPIPGSEFIMTADHVVLAIGQRPDTAQLNVRGLVVGGHEVTIQVEPATLETNLPDVFAGGDCVTGPNSVVDAVADGLRAAESIDRYLRGRSLKKGGRLDAPQPVEIDVRDRYASPYKRAAMPSIPRAQRMGTFEETNLGLPPWAAERESGRCLNCSLCSGCRECEEACELGAVFHDDSAEKLELEADVVIDFTADAEGLGGELTGAGQLGGLSLRKPGVYGVHPGDEDGIWGQMAQASFVALQVASKLDLKHDGQAADVGSQAEMEAGPGGALWQATRLGAGGDRVGVILCSCGDSISSVIDFAEVSREAVALPGVFSVQQIFQACTERGAQQVADHVAAWQVDRVVIAACRCCNLDQLCFSCTDRRVMCRQYLERKLPQKPGTVDFVNIREQCAWVHKDDPAGATRKAIEMISAAVARGRRAQAAGSEERQVEQSVLVVGDGLCGLAAASNMAAQGYSVALVSGPDARAAGRHRRGRHVEERKDLLGQLQKHGVSARPWPEVLELTGAPGRYEAVLTYRSETARISAGAVIFNLGEIGGAASALKAVPPNSLLGRILSQTSRSGGPGAADSQSIRGITIGETAGIFIVSSDAAESPEEHIVLGSAAAVRAWDYLARGRMAARANAVVVDSKLCRACGDCATVCPYIEMVSVANGGVCAYVDRMLCLGCGACIALCPTGAIGQPVQGDEDLTSTLEALLGREEIASAVE